VVFTLLQSWDMIFRVLCSQNPQIRWRHPRGKIEVESRVGEDDGYWSRDGGVMFEDTNNDCRANVAAAARQPSPGNLRVTHAESPVSTTPNRPVFIPIHRPFVSCIVR
jgi:hypothetical protein